MKNRECAENQAGLVDLAEGKENPQAERHLANCPECQRVYSELKLVLSAARVPMMDAPQELIQRAMSIMQARTRVVARLLSSSLRASMARRSGSDFQIVVGDDQTRVRLMANSGREGWLVSGKLPPGWSASSGSGPINVDAQGRFELPLKSLDAELVFTGENKELVVPSIADLIANEPD